MRCSSERGSQYLSGESNKNDRHLKVLLKKVWEGHEEDLYHDGGFISSPNNYTDAIVIPLILGLDFSLQNPFWVSTQSSCWTAAFVLSRKEIIPFTALVLVFSCVPTSYPSPAKECSSCCSNFCQSASCSSGKWVTKMRDMLSFYWDRLSFL